MAFRLELKITIGSLFSHLGTAITLATGFIFLYQCFGGDDNSPLIWGLTAMFFTCAFFMLLNVCAYAQSVLHDEVERCARAKSKLESATLKKRKSSKGKAQ